MASLEFTVSANMAFFDRTYPFVIESSDGISLYVPHLVPVEISGTTIRIAFLSANSCAGHSADCGDRRALKTGSDGYVTLGAKVGSSPTFIKDKEVPAWLAERVRRTYQLTAGIAQARFGPIDQRRVTITLVRQMTSGEPSWRGWTSGSQIFLVFSGTDWSQTDALERVVDLFVAHETIHLWNAWKAKQSAGLPPWVNEGSAEYLGTLALLEAGIITPVEAERHVFDSIDSCLLGMEDERYAVWKMPEEGRGVYSCGVAAQWIIDRSLRQAGTSSVWSLWRSIIERYGGRGYDADDVLAAFAADAKVRADALGWIDDPNRPLAGFAHVAATLGLAVAPNPRAASYLARLRETVLTGLLYQYCDGPPYGFYTLSESVRLDTGARCGLLSGDPELSAINGASLFSAQLAQIYTQLALECRRGGSIELERVGGYSLRVACKVPLASVDIPVAVACSAGEGRCLGGAGDGGSDD